MSKFTKQVMTGFWMAMAVSATAVAHSAHAATTSDQLSAKISQLQIDPSWTSAAKANGGEIALDLALKTATLTLNVPRTCPKLSYCMDLLPAPITVELPITDVATSRCGSVTYTAHQDSRPTDGALEVLRVVNNSQNHCKTLIELPATYVEYKTTSTDRQTGQAVVLNSTFVADRLSASAR